MKILYLSSAIIPSRTANSLQVMKMCEAFAQDGHDVRLIAPQRGDAPASDEAELARLYGLRSPVMPEYRRWWQSPVGTSWYALRGRASAGRGVVFTRDPLLGAACILTGAKTVLEMHQLPATGAARRALRFAVIRSGNGRVKVVAISRALRDDICRQTGVPDCERIDIAPDGVDVELFESAPSRDQARLLLGLPLGQPIAGYAGSLYAGKGADLVVELAGRTPGVHFVIVGGGDRLGELKSRVGNQLSNLTFAGQVSNTEIPTWLSACDMMLLPNQRRVEGSGGGDIGKWTSPLKMFEYMAAGKPIVSSELAVLREVLDDEVATFVDPEEVGEWSSAVMRLTLDVERRISMGEAARLRSERYSWRSRARSCLAGINL